MFYSFVNSNHYSYIGLSIGAARYLSGTTEGSTVLYKCDKFPFHALGSVNFMWKPETKSDDTMETDQVARCHNFAKFRIFFSRR